MFLIIIPPKPKFEIEYIGVTLAVGRWGFSAYSVSLCLENLLPYFLFDLKETLPVKSRLSVDAQDK